MPSHDSFTLLCAVYLPKKQRPVCDRERERNHYSISLARSGLHDPNRKLSLNRKFGFKPVLSITNDHIRVTTRPILNF